MTLKVLIFENNTLQYMDFRQVGLCISVPIHLFLLDAGAAAMKHRPVGVTQESCGDVSVLTTVGLRGGCPLALGHKVLTFLLSSLCHSYIVCPSFTFRLLVTEHDHARNNQHIITVIIMLTFSSRKEYSLLTLKFSLLGFYELSVQRNI